jgi:hypothetical protein
MWTVYVLKRLARLGDRASVGLLKTVDERDRADPRTIELLLQVIRAAFYEPRFISEEADKKPDVTFLFLEHLRNQTGEPALKKAICKLEAFVAAQTGVPKPPSGPGEP